MMSNKRPYTVMTIAGFDGSGGAGLQADLKTFSALGCYGMSVLTAVPVQNTRGVRTIYELPPQCIEEQIDAIFDDSIVDTVKIGMLYRAEIMEIVVKALKKRSPPYIVLDPVMVAKSGHLLLLPKAISAMKELLLPLATVVTPNLLESSALLGCTIQSKEEMEWAAQQLTSMGPKAALVKGGHLSGSCDDCLYIKDSHQKIHWFSHARINTKNTHGTGCTLSAAIAAFLAKGLTLVDATSLAKEYLTRSIEAGASLRVGHGQGPLHHFHHLWNFIPSPNKDTLIPLEGPCN